MIGLAPGFDAVVPQLRREAGEPTWEPLHALYRRSCARAIAARLAAGDRQVISFLADVRTRPLTPAEVAAIDPQARSFFNINTPDDWRRAHAPARASP
jgi:molybdopterin-guanine dinucleotide biosynthesis protein A